MAVLDRDPNNASNLLLVYSGFSVDATWDSGVTWNREHLWPDSLGIDGSGIDMGDLFNLRPSDPGVNSDRSNEYYFNVPIANTGIPQSNTNEQLAIDGVENPAAHSPELLRHIAGYDPDARALARHTIDVLSASDDPVVVPSGSCGGMLRKHYPALFAQESSERAAAEALVDAHRAPGSSAFVAD